MQHVAFCDVLVLVDSFFLFCYGYIIVLLQGVPRHKGRVIFLEYTGSGPITRTLFLVGKVCCNFA